MRKRLVLLSVALVFGLAPRAHADTFLQWFQVTTVGVNPWTITANGAGTQTTITVADLPVFVNITDNSFCLEPTCGGLFGDLTGYQLDFTATSTNAATLVGSDVNQNYAGSFSFTHGATNVLTVDFTDIFTGATGGSTATLAAGEPPDTFSGSSDIFDPAKLGIPRGFAFSFSDWTPGVGITNTTLASATADGSGTINATPVPEPGTLVLLGSGLLAAGRFGRRKLSRR